MVLDLSAQACPRGRLDSLVARKDPAHDDHERLGFRLEENGRTERSTRANLVNCGRNTGESEGFAVEYFFWRGGDIGRLPESSRLDKIAIR